MRYGERMPVGAHALWAAPCAVAAVAIGLYVHRRIRAWMPIAARGEACDRQAVSAPIAGLTLLPVLLSWQLANAQGYALPAVTASLAFLGHFDDRRAARGGKASRLRSVAMAVATAVLAAQHARCEASFAFAFAWLLAFALVQATRALEVGNGLCAAVTAGAVFANEWLLGEGGRWQPYAGWTALGFLPWCWARPHVALGVAGAHALGVCVAQLALDNLPLGLLSQSSNAVQFERAWEHGMLAVLILLPFLVHLAVFARGVVAHARFRA